jgi:opacity protein-like surface antigen
MRKTLALIAPLVLSLALPSAALAQRERGPVPNQGMVGVSFSLSAAIPTDGTLKTGPQMGVSADAYLSRRVSVRGLFAANWMDVTGHSFTGTASPVFGNGSLVYNWEGGRIHPFVTGGVGMYHFRFEDNGIHGSDTRVGLSLGGGAEYFLTRHDTVLGEVTYHAIDGPVTSPLTHYNPSFWTIAGGYKKYF